jgi:hypothetical protein
VAGGNTTLVETIGHWKIQGDATACEAIGEFEDGTTLSFLINSHGAIIVGVINQNWSIPQGKYEVVMSVDRAALGTFKADATGPVVFWQVPFTEATMNLFAYGRALRAKIGQAYVSYDLGRSEAAIKALLRCAAPRQEPNNPFASSHTPAAADNPFAETTSNPYRRM